MKKYLLLLTIAFATLCLVVLGFKHTPKFQPAVKPSNYLIAKLATNRVSPIFEPVFIYRTKIGWREGTHAGVGTLFVTKEGPRLMTALHVLSEVDRASVFVIRKLQPLEKEISVPVGVEDILTVAPLHIPIERNESDFVLCKIGEAKPLGKIQSAKKGGSESDVNMSTLPLEKQFKICSLVTGEQARVVAFGKCYSDGSVPFLIVYRSVAGESGTGFVSEDGRLFILTGLIAEYSNADDFREHSVVESGSPLSMVVGAFRPW